MLVKKTKVLVSMSHLPGMRGMQELTMGAGTLASGLSCKEWRRESLRLVNLEFQEVSKSALVWLHLGVRIATRATEVDMPTGKRLPGPDKL